ncbi:hypothetical protein AAG570_010418 [Ranatra chinensis]|uniref:Uncharacterized protein n=1 Tax=Ranatra chinensis TaxID=642074 RepID=A0ABD0Z4L1_9HEMI
MIECRPTRKKKPTSSGGQGDSVGCRVQDEEVEEEDESATQEECASCLHSIPHFRERSWERLDDWLWALHWSALLADTAALQEFDCLRDSQSDDSGDPPLPQVLPQIEDKPIVEEETEQNAHIQVLN